jgi:predicted metal-binding protein
MNQETKIENTEVGWEETVVMICSQCGAQFSDSQSLESPARIKSELKTKAKSELGKKVRVITTSCLNICPVDKIAITVASTKEPGVFKAYAVDPRTSGEELYNKILKK